MNDTTKQDEILPAADPPGLRTLVIRGSIMALLLLAALLAILLLVPDGNDYGKAARLKQDRLHSLPGSRIVMVGGSNLAFGIDSLLIESITGCPVVNMGMNGYFGVRFMLEEADSGLRAGDVVVIAFEFDSFVKSVEGAGADLLMVGKTVPRSLTYMTPMQLASAAKRIPFVVRRKVSRVTDEAAQGIYDALMGRRPEPPSAADIDHIESLAGFTREGDLVSHLGVKWPYSYEDGMDLTELPLDSEVLPLVRQFAKQMQQRGVEVLFSYTPVMRRYYAQHEQAIREIDARVRKDLVGVALVPRGPEEFVYDDNQFFDTVYHLARGARDQRSRLVAQDVLGRNPGSPHCRGTKISAIR